MSQQSSITLMKQFPKSRKVYVEGSRPDLLVPFREIELSDTLGPKGEVIEKNAPFRVYDTSGPYTDESYTVDLTQGLPALKRNLSLRGLR